MKISFYSNFLNHHQLELCLEMKKKLGNKFTFVATEPIPKERLDLGYHDMNKEYDFVLEEYLNDSTKKEAERLIIDSDVVIFGSAPKEYMNMRIKTNKLTFRYSERLLRKGLYKAYNPLRFLKNYYQFAIKEKNNYLLAASGYAALDYSMYKSYSNRVFKWGYFPKVIEYDIENLIEKKSNDRIKILWVGRFLNLKRPKDVIEMTSVLVKKGYDFEVNLIGIGPEIENLKKIISENNLGNVNLLGSMSPEKVRNHMEKSNIFLFTSDFGEGWGAVLNEAMNSGCAVVTSHAIGSVPFLINESNGFIYESGNIEDLSYKVEQLITNKNLREQMGVNAYKTLKNTWNAKTAANRLIELIENLSVSNQIYFKEGPLSKANIISQKYEGR